MKSLRIFLIFGLLLYASSCSYEPIIRGPNSVPEETAITPPKDLKVATEQFLTFIQSNQFQADNCAFILNKIYREMYRLDANYFNKENAIQNANAIIQNLWQSKLALRIRLKEFYEHNALSRPCTDASRNIFRAGRYLEDYVGYLKLNPAPFDEKNVLEAYGGGFPYLLTKERELEFKSGDILMSRGTAFTSAAIARVGDIDAQFSHLAILYIDEQTGKKYTIEAHIEIGTKVFTLDEYLKDGKGRAVLFRYPDAQMAHLAAKKMFEQANRATNSGANIPYDFGMVTEEPSQLFCSEVVQFAYDMAAKEMNKNFHIPLFPTSISIRNRDFFNSLSIRVQHTFAPADMEVDPRVELIAEWRDFSRVRMFHYHDAVLVSIYDWMERYDYTIHGDTINYFKKNIVWNLRKWPLFSELLKNKFPKNMPKETLGTIFKLNSIAENMFHTVKIADERKIAKSQLPMTPLNMEQYLESFRIYDLKTYQERRDCSKDCNNKNISKIHWDFRSRNEP